MHLILTGATGLVGSAVLHHMIALESVTAVSVLSRRPVPMAEGHPKVKVIIQKDYSKYPSEILEQLKGAEGCVWAQGISATQVSKSDYENITYEYPLAAAKAFSSLSDPFKFVYVSGEGATTTPGMFTPYFGVIKGRAEATLLELSKSKDFPSASKLKVYSLRPAGVDPTYNDPEINNYIPNRKGYERVVQFALMPILRGVMSSMVSPTADLAKVLVNLAMGDGKPLDGTGITGEGRTISNVGMRRLAGLD